MLIGSARGSSSKIKASHVITRRACRYLILAYGEAIIDCSIFTKLQLDIRQPPSDLFSKTRRRREIPNIMSFLRNPLILFGVNLSAIAGSTLYLRSHHVYNLEEHEARMDELEGMCIDILLSPLIKVQSPPSVAMSVFRSPQ